MWQLSNKDQTALNALTQQQIDSIPDEDEKAVFFGEGTQQEYKDNELDKKGLKGIFGLGNE